ncbi:MAG TPA: glutathione S-transferase family protein [Aquabacterium sp.]|nr:glutathione S-transferase family protein [Aquabacterium sp.]
MYTLHIANKLYSSWSLRPWLLMQVQGIPFDEQLHAFQPPSNGLGFKVFSPTGKVPCLIDGEQVVWDSLGIVEYLAERHPGVWPDDSVARAWARCATAEMHSGFMALRQHCSMHCSLRIRLRERLPAVQSDIDRIQALWTEGLTRFGGAYLAGSRFTAVDAFYAPVAIRFQTYGIELPVAMQAYADRLLNLPAMQAWVAAARREPWRDPAHEADVLAAGEVIGDAWQGAS